MKQNWQQVCRARRGACGACWGRGKAMKLKRNQKETTTTKKRDGNSINNSNNIKKTIYKKCFWSLAVFGVVFRGDDV